MDEQPAAASQSAGEAGPPRDIVPPGVSSNLASFQFSVEGRREPNVYVPPPITPGFRAHTYDAQQREPPAGAYHLRDADSRGDDSYRSRNYQFSGYRNPSKNRTPWPPEWRNQSGGRSWERKPSHPERQGKMNTGGFFPRSRNDVVETVDKQLMSSGGRRETSSVHVPSESREHQRVLGTRQVDDSRPSESPRTAGSGFRHDPPPLLASGGSRHAQRRVSIEEGALPMDKQDVPKKLSPEVSPKLGATELPNVRIPKRAHANSPISSHGDSFQRGLGSHNQPVLANQYIPPPSRFMKPMAAPLRSGSSVAADTSSPPHRVFSHVRTRDETTSPVETSPATASQSVREDEVSRTKKTPTGPSSPLLTAPHLRPKSTTLPAVPRKTRGTESPSSLDDDALLVNSRRLRRLSSTDHVQDKNTSLREATIRIKSPPSITKDSQYRQETPESTGPAADATESRVKARPKTKSRRAKSIPVDVGLLPDTMEVAKPAMSLQQRIRSELREDVADKSVRRALTTKRVRKETTRTTRGSASPENIREEPSKRAAAKGRRASEESAKQRAQLIHEESVKEKNDFFELSADCSKRVQEWDSLLRETQKPRFSLNDLKQLMDRLGELFPPIPPKTPTPKSADGDSDEESENESSDEEVELAELCPSLSEMFSNLFEACAVTNVGISSVGKKCEEVFGEISFQTSTLLVDDKRERQIASWKLAFTDKVPILFSSGCTALPIEDLVGLPRPTSEMDLNLTDHPPFQQLESADCSVEFDEDDDWVLHLHETKGGSKRHQSRVEQNLYAHFGGAIKNWNVMAQGLSNHRSQTLQSIEEEREGVYRAHSDWLISTDKKRTDVDWMFRFGVLPVAATCHPENISPAPSGWPWTMPGAWYTGDNVGTLDRLLLDSMSFSLGIDWKMKKYVRLRGAKRFVGNSPTRSLNFVTPECEFKGSNLSVSSTVMSRFDNLLIKARKRTEKVRSKRRGSNTSTGSLNGFGYAEVRPRITLARQQPGILNLVGPSPNWHHSALTSFSPTIDFPTLCLLGRIHIMGSLRKRIEKDDDVDMPLIWSLNELALWAEKLLAGGKDFQKLSVSGSTTKTSHQCASFYYQFKHLLRIGSRYIQASGDDEEPKSVWVKASLESSKRKRRFHQAVETQLINDALTLERTIIGQYPGVSRHTCLLTDLQPLQTNLCVNENLLTLLSLTRCRTPNDTFAPAAANVEDEPVHFKLLGPHCSLIAPSDTRAVYVMGGTLSSAGIPSNKRHVNAYILAEGSDEQAAYRNADAHLYVTDALVQSIKQADALAVTGGASLWTEEMKDKVAGGATALLQQEMGQRAFQEVDCTTAASKPAEDSARVKLLKWLTTADSASLSSLTADREDQSAEPLPETPNYPSKSTETAPPNAVTLKPQAQRQPQPVVALPPKSSARNSRARASNEQVLQSVMNDPATQMYIQEQAMKLAQQMVAEELSKRGATPERKPATREGSPSAISPTTPLDQAGLLAAHQSAQKLEVHRRYVAAAAAGDTAAANILSNAAMHPVRMYQNVVARTPGSSPHTQPTEPHGQAHVPAAGVYSHCSVPYAHPVSPHTQGAARTQGTATHGQVSPPQVPSSALHHDQSPPPTMHRAVPHLPKRMHSPTAPAHMGGSRRQSSTAQHTVGAAVLRRPSEHILEPLRPHSSHPAGNVLNHQVIIGHTRPPHTTQAGFNSTVSEEALTSKIQMAEESVPVSAGEPLRRESAHHAVQGPVRRPSSGATRPSRSGSLNTRTPSLGGRISAHPHSNGSKAENSVVMNPQPALHQRQRKTVEAEMPAQGVPANVPPVRSAVLTSDDADEAARQLQHPNERRRSDEHGSSNLLTQQQPLLNVLNHQQYERRASQGSVPKIEQGDRRASQSRRLPMNQPVIRGTSPMLESQPIRHEMGERRGSGPHAMTVLSSGPHAVNVPRPQSEATALLEHAQRVSRPDRDRRLSRDNSRRPSQEQIRPLVAPQQTPPVRLVQPTKLPEEPKRLSLEYLEKSAQNLTTATTSSGGVVVEVTPKTSEFPVVAITPQSRNEAASGTRRDSAQPGNNLVGLCVLTLFLTYVDNFKNIAYAAGLARSN